MSDWWFHAARPLNLLALATAALLCVQPQARGSASRSMVQSAVYQAGAAREDITPPAGLLLGGHGPAAAISRGQLTRLFARAVYIRADGSSAPTSGSLLLVSVDAFAVTHVFGDAIRSELRRSNGLDLPASAVIVAATHTHHGPASFLASAVYNQHAARFGGYVEEMREFLVNRIVSAAVRAVDDARTAGAVTLHLGVGAMPVASLRNRSPETFLLNRDAAEIMAALSPDLPATPDACAAARLDGEPEEGWRLGGCPRLRAVDRSIKVVRIDRDGRAIARLVFLAAHPTVLPTDTPLFSGDFTGVAAGELERREGTVVAVFNGAEGDITTRRTSRDLRDLWRHADWLRASILQAAPVPFDGLPGIVRRMHYAKPGQSLPEAPTLFLARSARGGAAALGGAEGDRTPLYALGWRERVTADRADPEHGAKLDALDSNLVRFLPNLTALLATPRDFPQALPLGYARVGSLEIMTAPTEMSTALGFRLRNLANGGSVAIIGLANEYGSYTATEEEYARQDYMGASTLWGPREAIVFEEVLRRLRNQTPPLPKDATPKDRPGKPAKELLRPYAVGAARLAVDEDLDSILRDAAGNPVRDLPYFTWRECGERHPYEDARTRRVHLEGESGQVVDDDGSGRLVVLLLAEPSGHQTNWAAIWTASLVATPTVGSVRFVVHGADGRSHASAWFDSATDRGSRGHGQDCPR